SAMQPAEVTGMAAAFATAVLGPARSTAWTMKGMPVMVSRPLAMKRMQVFMRISKVSRGSSRTSGSKHGLATLACSDGTASQNRTWREALGVVRGAAAQDRGDVHNGHCPENNPDCPGESALRAMAASARIA